VEIGTDQIETAGPQRDSILSTGKWV